MPAFIIASAGNETILCGLNAIGQPDRKSGVPVKATITEKSIMIDDEPRPRSIISAVTGSGSATYLIDGAQSPFATANAG